jgi:alpha-galactosidase
MCAGRSSGSSNGAFELRGAGVLNLRMPLNKGREPMKRVIPTLVLILALMPFAAGAEEHGKTPAAGQEFSGLTAVASPQPCINGPRVYGVRPGSPLLYRVAATGQRPMTFAAQNLPAGLALDAQSGILSGTLAQPGTYRVQLIAKNGQGEAQREFRIVAGTQLALTPPMGWNSWYIHYHRVSDQVMRQAADQMIASGMADYGYQYVNIDDCWMVKRDSTDATVGGPTRAADGRILPNKRFPDMRALTNYIHAKGLKAGIYTSPGPATCANCEGSYGHEALDARTFADWGFDFLKYDWCSYSKKAGDKSLAEMKKPYQLMWQELQKLDRDIVFNLCQYGMGDVWKWGGEVGHCWRTTGDLGLQRGDALPAFYKIGLKNAQHWQYAHPGAWNDPDYVLIGWVGDARNKGEGRLTTLTPDEQRAYMALWSLMTAPLIFSGDMVKLDRPTLSVLCNPEVIEVDQDPLGQQARIIRQSDSELVLAKDMENGSKVVGLFNLASSPAVLAARWEELGLTGKRCARDLWRQKDLGDLADVFQVQVAPHGVMLVRLDNRPAEKPARVPRNVQ